jgi:outer membrane biosynthesis protein TonB
MIRSSPVLRAVPATVAAVGMALAVGLGTVGSAHAESPTAEPAPTVCESCEQPTTGPGEDQGKPDPKPTQEPPAPAQPAVPAPAPPAKQVPAAPEPEPTLAPVPSATVEETATAEPTTASPSPTPSTAGPSTESNWNKPITKSAKPTQAAAVSGGDDSGSTGLLPITAGVLLVGLGGLSFAWWSRNRISAH